MYRRGGGGGLGGECSRRLLANLGRLISEQRGGEKGRRRRHFKETEVMRRSEGQPIR